MDYEKEVSELESYENTDWFRPQKGRYDIVILSEPQPHMYDDGNEKREQILLTIETEGKEYKWTVTKSLTMAGLYGQLMQLGKMKGKLAGEKATLIVKNDGKKNDYTIMEVIDSQPKEEAVA